MATPSNLAEICHNCNEDNSNSHFFVLCACSKFKLCCKCFLNQPICTACNGALSKGLYIKGGDGVQIKTHNCPIAFLTNPSISDILSYHRNLQLVEGCLSANGDIKSIVDIFTKLGFPQSSAMCQTLFAKLFWGLHSNQDSFSDIENQIFPVFLDRQKREIFSSNSVKIKVTEHGKRILKAISYDLKFPTLKALLSEVQWASESSQFLLPYGPEMPKKTCLPKIGIFLQSMNSIFLFFLCILMICHVSMANMDTSMCHEKQDSILCKSSCGIDTFIRGHSRNSFNMADTQMLWKAKQVITNPLVHSGSQTYLPRKLTGSVINIFHYLKDRLKYSNILSVALLNPAESIFNSPFFKIDMKYNFFRRSNQIFIPAPSGLNYFGLILHIHLQVMNSTLEYFYLQSNNSDTYPCFALAELSFYKIGNRATNDGKNFLLSTDVSDPMRFANYTIVDFFHQSLIIFHRQINNSVTAMGTFRMELAYQKKILQFVCQPFSAILFNDTIELSKPFYTISQPFCKLTFHDKIFHFHTSSRSCKPIELINCKQVDYIFVYIIFAVFIVILIFQFLYTQNYRYIDFM